MRLIDADKLLEDLKENCATDCNVCGYSTSDVRCGLIVELPTAYDIDKVVEQLEALPHIAKLIEREEAIKIVKGGAK